MLARVYDPKKHNPIGWWASEKLDGIRAMWDGKIMVTRQGYEIPLPMYLKKLLPTDVHLDGEMYFGRQKFESTGLLRRNSVSDNELRRAGLKFMVFDVIDEKIGTEGRHEIGKKIVKQARERCDERVCPIRWVRQAKVRSRDDLAKMLRDVVDKGGEGLMIKRPFSYYEKKRTSNLLKIKPIKRGEGTVVGYKKNKDGNIGSIRIEFGTVFLYAGGLTVDEKTNAQTLFPMGSTIAFHYNELTKNGVPRHPRIAK